MSTVTEASFRCQLKSGRLCLTNLGKVYDVTEFADRHPGGRELLENHLGQDVTQLMKSTDLHKHSPAAYKMLDKYYIGDLQVNDGVVYRGRKEVNGNVVPSLKNGLKNGHIKNGHVANGHMTNGHTANGHTANGHMEENSHDYDDIIDLSKPVFWQVGSLGDKYFDWCHSPIDEPLRLFSSDLCEFLSKSYWWLVLLYWIPVSSGILWYSYSQLLEQAISWNIIGLGPVDISTGYFPLLFIIGFLLWTIDEYIVHRWLFHCKPPGTSKFLITLHFLFHGQHHKSPMDKCRLVFPPLPATLLGFFIYCAYKLFAPPAIAQVLFGGTIVGYLCYDLVHYYLHHGHPSMSYFKNLKTYHVKHHFKEQNKGFGISSKLWDYPFGTLIE